MAWTAPTASDFRAFFVRDFNYAPTGDPNNLEFITDADIARALSDALIAFNPSLFGDDGQSTTGFMYLAAFHLTMAIQNSMKGIASQFKFPVSSNSVNGVSVNFQLPERYATDPVLSIYTHNGYGMKYLSLVLPFLIGNVQVQCGTTTFA
jgi:hypothetical protein